MAWLNAPVRGATIVARKVACTEARSVIATALRSAAKPTLARERFAIGSRRAEHVRRNTRCGIDAIHGVGFDDGLPPKHLDPANQRRYAALRDVKFRRILLGCVGHAVINELLFDCG